MPVAPGIALYGSFSGDYKMHSGDREYDQGNLGAAGGVSPITTGLIMLAGVSISGLFIWLVHTHDVSSELSA